MRKHSGGYIQEEAYLNIGTEEARGRDGDNARIAAKKYNDHKHAAHIALTIPQVDSWAREPQLESSIDGIPGGFVENNGANLARNEGDMVSFQGNIFMYKSPGTVSPITLGLGGKIETTNNITTFVSDVMVEHIPLRTNNGISLESLELNTNAELIISKGIVIGNNHVIANADTKILIEVVAGINRPTGQGLTAIETKLFSVGGVIVAYPTVFITIKKENFVGNSIPVIPSNNAFQAALRIEKFKDLNPFYNEQAYELGESTVANNVENSIYFVGYRRSSVEDIYTGETSAQNIIDTNYAGIEQDFLNDLDTFWNTCSFDIISMRLKIKNTFGAGI